MSVEKLEAWLRFNIAGGRNRRRDAHDRSARVSRTVATLTMVATILTFTPSLAGAQTTQTEWVDVVDECVVSLRPFGTIVGGSLVDVEIHGVVDARCTPGEAYAPRQADWMEAEITGEVTADESYLVFGASQMLIPLHVSVCDSDAIIDFGSYGTLTSSLFVRDPLASVGQEIDRDAPVWQEQQRLSAADDCSSLKIERNRLVGGPSSAPGDCFISIASGGYESNSGNLMAQADAGCDGELVVTGDADFAANLFAPGTWDLGQGGLVCDGAAHEILLEAPDSEAPGGKVIERIRLGAVSESGSPGDCSLGALQLRTRERLVEVTSVIQPAGPGEDQILRLYQAVFGRLPDAGGFEFWTSQYRGGRDLESIVEAFVASPEFASRYGADPSNQELVDAMYRNVLGRAGDPGGVQFWLDRLTNGMSVTELLQSFADSPENIEATGTSQPLSSIESKVLRLYRAVYGRTPDESGFRFWVDQAVSGRSMLSIAVAFEAAPEFDDRYGADPTDEELIDALYRNVLGRAGDRGGIDFWLGQRRSGTTIPELLLAFANSSENLEQTGTRP